VFLPRAARTVHCRPPRAARLLTRRMEQTSMNAQKISVAKKGALLEAAHHRVKNNPQVLARLLNLQARQIKARQITEQRVLALFEDTRNRVIAISSIHQQFYRGATSTSIEFERAVPFAKLLSELVSNACKHSSPLPETATIRIGTEAGLS
jgi:two-component sensor histidine kinase